MITHFLIGYLEDKHKVVDSRFSWRFLSGHARERARQEWIAGFEFSQDDRIQRRTNG